VSYSTSRKVDPAARFLELGLCLTVIVAPLPFGAVGPGGRLMLEVAALVLGGVWLIRALVSGAALPSRSMAIGLAGLLLLGAVQMWPVGKSIVSFVSPASMDVRSDQTMTPTASAAEFRLLGVDPASLNVSPSISVDPAATASAVRTGAAAIVFLLVAATVAATTGVRRLAQALLISASFQGLYGILVLASGHDMIWDRAKVYYIDAATGTFVNKNHFAGFLAMTLACGLALVLSQLRQSRGVTSGRRRVFLLLLGNDGSRLLVWSILLSIGLAGLLASLSRAGIAVGLVALALTLFFAGRKQGTRTRVIAIVVILVAAAIPVAQLGSDQLVQRFSSSAFDLTKAGARTTVWGDTLAMAIAFPVTGAGFGTFASAYPVFRSPDVRLYYAHAHNDLLQVWAEGGLIGLVLAAMIVVPLIRLIVACLTLRKGTLAAGFAAGLLAVLLHALVDFNFHIPANLTVAGVLAGVLIGLPWKGQS
jgi:O-antigen ligase